MIRRCRGPASALDLTIEVHDEHACRCRSAAPSTRAGASNMHVIVLHCTAQKMRPIVLITGASGGLGLESARALLQSDTAYEVILGARSLQRGEAAVQTMLEDCKGDVKMKGSTVWPLQLDIEDDSSIEAAVETVRRKAGHIDVLINNAGGSAQTFIRIIMPNRTAERRRTARF